MARRRRDRGNRGARDPWSDRPAAAARRRGSRRPPRLEPPDRRRRPEPRPPPHPPRLPPRPRGRTSGGTSARPPPPEGRPAGRPRPDRRGTSGAPAARRRDQPAGRAPPRHPPQPPGPPHRPPRRAVEPTRAGGPANGSAGVSRGACVLPPWSSVPTSAGTGARHRQATNRCPADRDLVTLNASALTYRDQEVRRMSRSTYSFFVAWSSRAMNGVEVRWILQSGEYRFPHER